MRILIGSALVVIASVAPAAAYDPIVLERGWYRVDAFESGECAGEVGTNGRFYAISASGFAPSETAYLTITNGDMVPIERAVRTSGAGRWQDYYIPFRPNRGEGGEVTVTLAGQSCTVPLELYSAMRSEPSYRNLRVVLSLTTSYIRPSGS